MNSTIQILPGFHKRFAAGYPWLYANEIVQSQPTKSIEAGEQVAVEYQGKFIALGYYNRHSLISFRVLSRDLNELIDIDFFIKKLQQALALRERFYPTAYYRLIHAEADGLPGLIIDRFDTVLVMQINTQGMEKLKETLLLALKSVFNPTTIFIKNDSAIRQLENLPLLEPEILGAPINHLPVLENGTKFSIDLTSSQKTGWFFDHQENRQQIAALAKDKTVIDYFCYSGGFGIQAAIQKAKKVIGVDRSEIALQNAKESAKLNNVSEICEFVLKDVFDDLDERLKNNETFDIVILDPPAFVKAKKDLNTGLRGYEKLLTKAIPLVTNQGLLLIASCSYHVKELELKNCLIRALINCKREGKILRTLAAGPDHPQHPMLEESSYLKGFWVTINDFLQ